MKGRHSLQGSNGLLMLGRHSLPGSTGLNETRCMIQAARQTPPELAGTEGGHSQPDATATRALKSRIPVRRGCASSPAGPPRTGSRAVRALFTAQPLRAPSGRRYHFIASPALACPQPRGGYKPDRPTDPAPTRGKEIP